MLKYAVIIAAAAAMIMIVWPAIAGFFGDRPNEAQNLVEATSQTSNKAGTMGDSFSDVIPPHREPAPLSPQNGNVTPPAQAAIPGTEVDPAGTPETNGEPTPTPTPDPYAHSSEHAVRDAMEYLHRLQTEMNPTRTEYIEAVEQLERAWTPRYERAVDEYKRFARRIDHAADMANEYFPLQRRLTAETSNPQRRRVHELRDEAEYQAYLKWRDQAFDTQAQAYRIMLDLHDMNITITKQNLSAHFQAIYQDFQEIPIQITQLHEELARFQEESARIQSQFGINPDVDLDE